MIFNHEEQSFKRNKLSNGDNFFRSARYLIIGIIVWLFCRYF